jgi:hypothetical protein
MRGERAVDEEPRRAEAHGVGERVGALDLDADGVGPAVAAGELRVRREGAGERREARGRGDERAAGRRCEHEHDVRSVAGVMDVARRGAQSHESEAPK